MKNELFRKYRFRKEICNIHWNLIYIVCVYVSCSEEFVDKTDKVS